MAESLTVLGRELRQLTQRVGELSEEVRRMGRTLELETKTIRDSVAQLRGLFFCALLPMMLTMVGTVVVAVLALVK